MNFKRLEYIDCIRGLCIIFVVVWHLSFEFGLTSMFFNRVLKVVRMPLFFFVSGFLCPVKITPSLIVKKIKIRLLWQLVPTLIVGVLYVFWVGRSFVDVLWDINKAGYWFTLVLFEIFIVFSLISILLEKLNLGTISKYVYIFLLFAFGIFSAFSHILDGVFLWHVFNGFYFVKFIPFFLFGVLANIYWSRFERLLCGNYILSFLFVIFVFFCFLTSKIGTAIQGYVGIILVFAFFYQNKNIFSGNTKIGKCLAYIGSYTLPIYLFHYFFIGGFYVLKPMFDVCSETNSWIIVFFMLLFLSFVVIGLCLFFERILRISPFLYSLLCGKMKKE